MPTWLNVAEKPSVAKEMAHVLSGCGGGQLRSIPSESRFNPVFEFSFEGNTMIVTSVAGHLMETEFPPETQSWATYPFQGLFSARIDKRVRASLEPVKRNLEGLARRAQVLVLWLDCDREGENIAFEVVQVALAQNRRLTVQRAHFSALTQRDLLGAVRSLRPPDRRLSEAVEARQEMDLRIGAAFTRFQSVRFGSAFSGIPRVLSFGPCQFPTLGFIVERHWERGGFVPEDLHTLHLAHTTTRFHSSRGPMFDQVAATVVYQDMLDTAARAGHRAMVTRVHLRPSRRRPPVPLATVVLQKLASTHLRIPSEECMTLAEQLYQEGFLSYPRTETDSFSFTDAELLELAQAQTADRNPVAAVREFAAAMVAAPQQHFRRPLRGGHDDKAHPPIHPTKPYPQAGGADNKARLFTLIVRHFLACLSPDAVAATTSVTAEFGAEAFTTSGTTILERGYLDIFTYENWNSSLIPNYTEGELFVPTDVRLERTRTVAPPNLSETDLITLMDDNGIGTDATIAQHIKTVLEREYVKREGQTLVPTKLGIALAAAYEVLGLSSLLRPQLRAQMENAMGDIAAGTATKEQVVVAAIGLYKEIFQRLEASSATFYDELKKYLEPRAGGGGGGGGDDGGGGGGAVLPDVPPAAYKPSKRKLTKCGRCGHAMDLVSHKEQGERGWEHWALRCGNARCTGPSLLRLPSGSLNSFEDTQVKCALCPFNALRMTSKERKTSYTLCPHCFSSPPAVADIEGLVSGVSGDFRCFQCTADCPLAKGLELVPITKCVSCGTGELRLRTNANGGFLSCRSYPECAFSVGLPRATSIKPQPSQRCPRCAAVLLLFDFTAGVQGVPGMDVIEAACVSCDARLRDYITVKGYKGPGSQQQQPQQQQGGGSAAYSLPTITATAPGARQQQPAAGGDAKCGCGAPAKRLVSGKEASMGKAFFTCATRKCKFFQWAE